MITVVFFLEELSAEEMLKGLLPKLHLENIHFEYIKFDGKQDLIKQLPRKLRAWRKPDCRFVVLLDQDSSDCKELKEKLREICKDANRNNVLLRIACHELESFYLGDLFAVEHALGISSISSNQGKKRYRNPDSLNCPSKELIRLTRGIYQKVSGSREIGRRLNLEYNRSHSFSVLVSGIRKIAGEVCS